MSGQEEEEKRLDLILQVVECSQLRWFLQLDEIGV